MKIFGIKVFGSKTEVQGARSAVPGGGWWPIIREPFSGAWQKNREIKAKDLRAFFPIYSCITLISGDVSKLPLNAVRVSDGIRVPAESPLIKVLEKPNSYQNRIQFISWWLTSKLSCGNTYILKVRDAKGNLSGFNVLNPIRVQPLVTPSGDVYYSLSGDELNGLVGAEEVVVPSTEIIHDRYQPQFHPLVGVTPIYAAALSGSLGMQIQIDSARFFQNGARPGGVLTAPGHIAEDTAKRMKEHWETEYSGVNAHRVAILGDGLTYAPMREKSTDAQLVEQLRLSAEIVCSCFHVPAFKIGMGAMPSGTKVEDMNLIYYSDCLQVLLEEIEILLNVESAGDVELEFDTGALMRMDTGTLYGLLGDGIAKSLLKPNEARRKANLPALDGGDTIYMQQQNYSLSALAKRDEANPLAPAPASSGVQGDDRPVGLDPDQVKTLKGIIFAIIAGQISVETGRAMIIASFPELDESDVDAMISGITVSPAPVADDEDIEAAVREGMK